MNLDRRGANELASAIREHVGDRTTADVAVFPPSIYVEEVARALAGSPVKVGGQNACDETSGAFTGEISAAMLADVGGTMVILGHSERRHIYGEGDELVNKKTKTALAAGLDVILCVGETIEEREAGQTEPVVRRQLGEGIAGLTDDDFDRLSIAYEPVWAIGTGLTASPEQAGSVHSYLRGVFAGLTSDAAANKMRILYGGSVKPSNVVELLAVPDIDGALVGGASLSPELFLPIVDAGLAL